MRIGILTDFPTQTTRSGPALQAEILRRGLEARGHAVVMLGPDTRSVRPAEPGLEMFLFRGISHPTHPLIRVSLPASLRKMRNPPDLDVLLAQTTNPMVSYANWIRRMWRVPVLNTHTIHLPTHSHYLLPDVLARMSVWREVARRLARIAERSFAELYNAGDMLIVQSPYLVRLLACSRGGRSHRGPRTSHRRASPGSPGRSGLPSRRKRSGAGASWWSLGMTGRSRSTG